MSLRDTQEDENAALLLLACYIDYLRRDINEARNDYHFRG